MFPYDLDSQLMEVYENRTHLDDNDFEFPYDDRDIFDLEQYEVEDPE